MGAEEPDPDPEEAAEQDEVGEVREIDDVRAGPADQNQLHEQHEERRKEEFEAGTRHGQQTLEAHHADCYHPGFVPLGVGRREDLGMPTATFVTSLGSFTASLMPDHAPKTVENFVSLAQGSKEWTDPRDGARKAEPLYPGTIFHRVIDGFMIQGGDPDGNGYRRARVSVRG